MQDFCNTYGSYNLWKCIKQGFLSKDRYVANLNRIHPPQIWVYGTKKASGVNK